VSSGISIDIAADTKSFVTNTEAMASALQDVADQLDVMAKAGDQGAATVSQAMREAQVATEQAGNAARQAAEKWSDFRPAVLQSDAAFADLATKAQASSEKVVASSEKVGEKVQESGKLGEAALMNMGFSSMQAGSLFTNGLQGMMEQAGTFAAFMGPSMAGVEGAVSALAWPLTIAGVALAALGGLMQNDSKDAQQLTQAVADYVNEALGSAKGSDALDEGLRKWAKSANDFGGMTLTDLKKNLKDTSIQFGDVAGAIATQSLPKMEQQKKAVDDLAQAIDNGFVPSSKVTSEGLRNVSETLNKNIEQQKLYKQVLEDVAQQAGFKTVAAYQLHEQAIAADTKAQQDWNNTLKQGFSSAAEASGDWAQSTKVDLNQVANNLNEYNAMIARLPQDEIAATKAGLSGAGLAYIESLPNGSEILDQMALNPGSPGAQALIAAANQTGQNLGKSTNDGVDAVGDPKTKTIKYVADTHEVEASLARLNGQTIYVDVKNRNGNRII
jgi:hypothetical protein